MRSWRLLTWNLASEAGDIAVVVIDLIHITIVIGGDRALLALRPIV